MMARFGNGAYWSACVFAAVWLPMIVGLQRNEADPEWGNAWIAGLAGAAIIWVSGRAIRYILAT